MRDQSILLCPYRAGGRWAKRFVVELAKQPTFRAFLYWFCWLPGNGMSVAVYGWAVFAGWFREGLMADSMVGWMGI